MSNYYYLDRRMFMKIIEVLQSAAVLSIKFGSED